MNTYKFTIETVNDTEEFEIEAAKASLNHTEGVIQAVLSNGHFKVVKLPEDWTSIEAEETLGEEEQKAYDEAMKQQEAMAEAAKAQEAAQLSALREAQQMQTNGPVLPGGPAPVAPATPTVPPGQ